MAGLAAFGLRMDAAALTVGFGTAIVFTRRTGRLAGAGLLAVPWSLWQSGAPLALAVPGVFACRVLVLWLPCPSRWPSCQCCGRWANSRWSG